MDYSYQFTHRKTGKHVIAASWNEYHKLNANSEYYNTYKRLGYNHTIGDLGYHNHKESSRAAERMNAFWKGAEGFEKIGRINCIGIPASGWFNPIRTFLKNVANHAAMQGDRTTYLKALESDKCFHVEGSVHQYLLPEHKGY